MMDGIRDWILSIASCALILSAVDCFVPKGAVKKVCAFAGGMFTLLVILRPITGGMEISSPDWIRTQHSCRDDRVQALTEQNETLLEKLIAEESQAYILEWAQELGIACKVTVVCRTDENGLPFPAEVTVSSDADAGALHTLSERIEAELAIPTECQIFREEQSR